MIEKMITFIGGGNMATAIISGLLSSGLSDCNHICATAAHESSVIRLKETLNIEATTDNKAAAQKADILFLAIKPNMFHKVIPEIRHAVKDDAIIVSIAAGQPIERIEEMFENSIKLVRVMPNTPAMVGSAMSAICRNDAVTDEDLAEIQAIFNSFGESEVVSESMIDTVIGVSGSSPAYVYMFIEAMADAAVAEGMPRAQAYKFAAQAVLGSAKMVLETGKHPGELKDMVCSPAGTTIEAVGVLEEHGFRSAIIDAMKACVDVAKGM